MTCFHCGPWGLNESALTPNALEKVLNIDVWYKESVPGWILANFSFDRWRRCITLNCLQDSEEQIARRHPTSPTPNQFLSEICKWKRGKKKCWDTNISYRRPITAFLCTSISKICGKLYFRVSWVKEANALSMYRSLKHCTPFLCQILKAESISEDGNIWLQISIFHPIL